MILLVVEGRGGKGKERNEGLCLSGMVWFCEREREKKTREKYNIYYKKKIP